MDLQGINAYRYANNITGGNQELMEAIAFQHYLETQCLISYEDSATKLAALSAGDQKVNLTIVDYLLGIYDMTGELMRFAITAMATGGQISTKQDDMDSNKERLGKSRTVLQDMRELRSCLELLSVSGSSLARDVPKKMDVMVACVEKVEKASYGQVVRGSERPKGWVPDLEERSREVEVA